MSLDARTKTVALSTLGILLVWAAITFGISIGFALAQKDEAAVAKAADDDRKPCGCTKEHECCCVERPDQCKCPKPPPSRR